MHGALDRDGLVELGDRGFALEREEPRIGTDETANVDRRADRLPIFVFDRVQVHRTDVNLFGHVREREPARFPRASELVSERRHVCAPFAGAPRFPCMEF